MRDIHKHKYAYCVARLAPHCAAFAIPPAWNKYAGMPYEPSVLVQDASANVCMVGRWYSLAYGDLEYGGMGPKVIAPIEYVVPTKKRTK